MFASALFLDLDREELKDFLFGVFAELRKATIIFVMFVCPYVCPSK
jgi:hypothetical protein